MTRTIQKLLARKANVPLIATKGTIDQIRPFYKFPKLGIVLFWDLLVMRQ